MKMVSINSFLLTGSFGGVCLGDSEADVLKVLGKPNDGYADGVLSKGTTGLVYERYEFMFNANRLIWIQNDHLDPKYPEHMFFENDLIRIAPEILNPKEQKNFAQVKHELDVLT